MSNVTIKKISSKKSTSCKYIDKSSRMSNLTVSISKSNRGTIHRIYFFSSKTIYGKTVTVKTNFRDKKIAHEFIPKLNPNLIISQSQIPTVYIHKNI